MRPEPHRSRRRLLATALLVGAAASLALAPEALADYLTPESGGGSRNAEDIDTLFKWVLAVAAVVFVGVEGTLLYSLLRFRQRRRKGEVAAQIRGNTSVEIGWTVGAALVLVVLTIVTFIMLPGIKNPARTGAAGATAGGPQFATIDQPGPPGGKGLTIDVNGQQYLWRYTYPNGAYAYTTMIVPTDTTVILRIRAQDVIHSWWVPKLGGKMDAVPGYTNRTWFKVTREGTYPGQCAELCGRGHAEMLNYVKAVSPTEYREWVNRQRRLITQANREAAQQRRQLSPIQ